MLCKFIPSKRNKNDIEVSKYRLGEYIFKIREGLLDKDLYIEILNNLEKVAQNLDAATYRAKCFAMKANEYR